MGCIFLFLSLVTPRLAVVLLWFLSDWFHGIFPTALVPIIGFIFLPTTLLWYTAVQHWYGGQWTVIPVVFLIVAFLIDISPARGRRWRRAPRDV